MNLQPEKADGRNVRKLVRQKERAWDRLPTGQTSFQYSERKIMNAIISMLRDMPHYMKVGNTPKECRNIEIQIEKWSDSKRKTQEGLLAETGMLVETDVKMPIHITNRDKKFYLPEISGRLEKNVTYDRIYLTRIASGEPYYIIS